MKTPKLSLCMIVKNGENTLGKCLESVASVVDEMIVVDTGSTDSSREIAEQFGAKVFRQTWQDDFSLARNAALKEATGDWILVLDADEQLDPAGIDKIKPLLKEAEHNAYLVQILNCSVDEKEPANYFADQSLRLFRNNPKYSYHGVVYEELDLVRDEPQSEIGEALIKIFHYSDHADSEEETAVRRKRNMKLLNRALEQEPDNPKLHYYMGDLYLGQRKWQKALNNFQLARNMSTDSYLQPLISRDIIMCLLELGLLKEALVEVARAHEKYPGFLDVHYLQGEIYAKMSQHKKALACFRECANLKNKPATYCQETGMGDAAVFGIGICGMILSHDELATEAFIACMKIDPTDAVSFEYLGQILLKQGSPAKAVEQLKGFADMTNPAIMEAMHRLGLRVQP